jgi:glucose/arabinose dehydrogenase
MLAVAAGCLGIWVLPSPCSASELFVGNFFGTDSNVLRYDGDTGAFKDTFVPFNSGGLTFPLGGAFGADKNFYVSNSNNDTVLRYNGATGAFINIFASNVEDAAGLAFGPDQNLYVANAADPGSVTKLNGMTGVAISELTGGGLSDPEGVVFGPDGNLYVANVGGDDIVRFNGTTGAFIDVFVQAGSGGLQSPRDLAFGPDGNIYVTSSGNTGGVLRYSAATGNFLNAFVGPGSDLFLPRGLVFGPDGNLYVGNFGAGDILRYNGTTGAFINTFVATGSGGLGGPTFLLFREDASNAVPEPSALGLVGLGLVGLGAGSQRTVRQNLLQRICRRPILHFMNAAEGRLFVTLKNGSNASRAGTLRLQPAETVWRSRRRKQHLI